MGGPLGNYRIKLDAYSNIYIFSYLWNLKLCSVCSKKKGFYCFFCMASSSPECWIGYIHQSFCEWINDKLRLNKRSQLVLLHLPTLFTALSADQSSIIGFIKHHAATVKRSRAPYFLLYFLRSIYSYWLPTLSKVYKQEETFGAHQ